jgi:hypothetical protein
MDRLPQNGYFLNGGGMKYWSNAFLGLGVTLIAATIIKFDWLGGLAGIISLFVGYALYRASSAGKE